MSALVPRYLWKPVAVVAALAFVYASVLVKLGSDWWEDENYSHGLLVPFIIGYILWSERDRLRRVRVHPSLWWGGAAVLCALVALWAGVAGAELFTQRMSLVLMLAGIVVYFWGFRLLRFVLVPLLLFVLAIPIPAIIFNKIAFPLQLFASRCAVWAMRMFDIPVLRQGNVIELMPLNATSPKRLEVVEACSGIRSLMTLVTLAVVFAYFTHPKSDGGEGLEDGGGGGRGLGVLKSYGFWRSLILVLSAVPIAILTNAGRVSGTGVLAHYYGTKVADGFFHSFSGWVVYIAAFLLLFAVGWVLDRVGNLGKGGRGGGRASSGSKEVAATDKTESASIAASATAGPAVGVPSVKGAE
ncbi:MAG TPA: exosortase [Pyrinomonadaceae bacterium]|jgi:exosortase|nr:exosortase [Pyrinomonadaceae bacterium]